MLLYITDYYKYNKSLFVFPGPYGCVDTEHTLSLLRKILEGVEYIHSRGIMHRDLKVRCFDRFYFSICLRYICGSNLHRYQLGAMCTKSLKESWSPSVTKEMCKSSQ